MPATQPGGPPEPPAPESSTHLDWCERMMFLDCVVLIGTGQTGILENLGLSDQAYSSTIPFFFRSHSSAIMFIDRSAVVRQTCFGPLPDDPRCLAGKTELLEKQFSLSRSFDDRRFAVGGFLLSSDVPGCNHRKCKEGENNSRHETPLRKNTTARIAAHAWVEQQKSGIRFSAVTSRLRMQIGWSTART